LRSACIEECIACKGLKRRPGDQEAVERYRRYHLSAARRATVATADGASPAVLYVTTFDVTARW
jgi:hypothetical protein